MQDKSTAGARSLMSLWQNITGMLGSALSRNENPTSAEEAIRMAQEQMSFGRYGDAERMLLSAMQREPARVDLKVRLAELYFIWGEGDKFLSLASQLRADRAAANEWQLIVVMGRQICPTEDLFR
jgi:pilus assembly protein FimV